MNTLYLDEKTIILKFFDGLQEQINRLQKRFRFSLIIIQANFRKKKHTIVEAKKDSMTYCINIDLIAI